MKFLRLFTILSLFAFSAVAQDTVQLKQQAHMMIATLSGDDYNTLIDHTYPALVDQGGGKDKMLQMLKKMITEMRAQGFTIQKASIGEPGKFFTSQDEIYSLVPEEVVIRFPKGIITEHAYLLAISKDGGKFWYFLDLNGKDNEVIRKMVPKLSSDLVLPAPVPPTIVEDKTSSSPDQ